MKIKTAFILFLGCGLLWAARAAFAQNHADIMKKSVQV